MTQAYVLRAEGVNFDATVYDTNDLSTVRGSSLTLLALDQAIERGFEAAGVAATQIFSGASQAAYSFEAADDDSAEAVARKVRDELSGAGAGNEAFNHLMFVCDVAGKDAGGLAVAEARNRTAQFRKLTVQLPPLEREAVRFDPLDRVRPAACEENMPGGGTRKLSHSVLARRKFGRAQRQQFYARQLAGTTEEGLADGLLFADSFEDIAAAAPAGLPVSVRNKVAVFYADGNRFSGLRARMDTAEFSRRLKALQAGLLAEIVSWFKAGGEAFQLDGQKQDRAGLRLETLLWGGDEVTFVMPACLGMVFARGFFDITSGWTMPVGGKAEPLTHAAGLVFCHHKTPIRQARQLAHDLADIAKDNMGKTPRNVIAIEAFESAVPPDEGIGLHRKRLYGDGPLEPWMCLPAEALDKLHLQRIVLEGTDLEPGSLPRSQVYRILHKVRSSGHSLTDEEASSVIKSELEDYFSRVRGEDLPVDLLSVPTLDGKERPLSLSLALAAGLRDYLYCEDLISIPPLHSAEVKS